MTEDKDELVNSEEVTYDFEVTSDGDNVIATEEDDEDLDELHGHKRLHVIKKGKERAVKILLVVENFRLAFYLVFLLLVVVGIILTTQFVEGDYEKILRDVFGAVSICVYFDFPPSSYVLPNIWVIALLFIEAYILVSVFRVWIAKEEEKVSQIYFVGYTLAMAYVGLSLIVFSTIFAVQPDPNKPATVTIHTAPYTNLTIAMGVLAVMVTWFGEKVAWRGMDLLPGFSYLNIAMLALQITTIPIKLVSHINCLADINNGLWWDPKTSPGINLFLQIYDYVFLLSVVLWPTIQSAYLSYKREKTHCVYMVLMDNRKGKGMEENSIEAHFN